MNFLVCVVFIGFICVSRISSTVIVTDSNTPSTTSVITVTATSKTESTVGSIEPLSEAYVNANQKALPGTVVQGAINKADTDPSLSSLDKWDKSKTSDQALAQDDKDGILGIIGSHDAVNLAVAENLQKGLSNSNEKAGNVPAQGVDSKDGNNPKLVNAEQETKHGSFPGKAGVESLGYNKTEKVLMTSDIHINNEAVAAEPVVQNQSPDTLRETGSEMNKIDHKTGCNVKNRICVPTQEELAGVSNVDRLQHRMSDNGLSPLKLNDKAIETNVLKSDKNAGCNVKNKTCVPTREELIAAGVSNVDLLQHRMSDNGLSPLKLNDKAVETNELKSDKDAGCNVKNKTCVPTREELTAAGVSNVDLVQHRITDFGPKQLNLDESLRNKITDTKVNNADMKTGCDVKNKTCVPTREELTAAGMSNVDLVQHQITDFGPKLLNLEEPLRKTIMETNVHNSDKNTGCNVKNKTCVPTERELIAAGVNTGEFVGQYRLDNENVFPGQLKKNDAKTLDESIAASNNINKDTDRPGDSGSNPFLREEIGTGEVSTLKTHANEIKKAIKLDTVQQIPTPGPTTAKTRDVDTLSTDGIVERKLVSLKTNTSRENKEIMAQTTQRLTTSAAEYGQASPEQTTIMTTNFQPCPNLTCSDTCIFGRKVNSDGCETCECKFSDDCPRVLSTSRLLCLLQASPSQGCTSNADCRRNRICCPGTCGPTCKRASRNRSMLLSMLVD